MANTDEEIVIYVDPQLKSLIPKFMDAQKTQLDLIKKALQEDNYEDLKRFGHRMRGSCASYGFAILGDLGTQIEKHAEAQDLKLLSQNIKQLESLISSLKIVYRDK